MDTREIVNSIGRFAHRHPDSTILAGLVALALAVRLPLLTTIPPNIMADEADNLQYVLRVLAGREPGFFGLDWKPAPAFSVHLMAWFAQVFGPTAVGLRMASVVLSTLTLIPFYYLAREQTGRVAATAAALLLSTSLWFLHFSRNGWENVHIAFFGAMAAWMLVLALKRRRYLFYFGAAGFFAVLGLYGYFAGRLIIVSLLIFLPIALWLHREQARRILAGYAVLVVVCAIAFLPQVPTILDDWENFDRRTRNVSVFNVQLPYEGSATMGEVVQRQITTTLRAFLLVDGAVMNNERYFPVSRPLFDPFTAVLYVAGLALGLLRWRRSALWWCFLAVPLVATQVFTTHIPDLARAIGAVPFMYLFAALALDALLRLKEAQLRVVQVAALLALPVASVVNVSDYVRWMAQPQAALAREPAVQVADLYAWVAVQTEEIQAGRPGLNVTEWHHVRGQVVRTPFLPPDTASPARSVQPQPEEAPVLDARFIARYGEPGTDDGQFANPRGVAVGPTGDIFVADTGNRRIQRFDADGRFLGVLPVEVAEPFDLAVAATGELYVVDPQVSLVEKFDADGRPAGTFGAEWGMYRPRGVAVDQTGMVYVADTGHNRIIVFSPDGQLERVVGQDQGRFGQPSDVAVDQAGNIYVADPTNGRLVKLDPQGDYLFEWQISRTNSTDAAHLAVTTDDRLLVTDPHLRRVVAFAPDGALLGAWDGAGDDEGILRLPIGIASDGEGNVYVVDTADSTLKKYSLPQ